MNFSSSLSFLVISQWAYGPADIWAWRGWNMEFMKFMGRILPMCFLWNNYVLVDPIAPLVLTVIPFYTFLVMSHIH